ncbi:MAG: carboxypeptidase-like regulatory domain-containing protein [Candidatus Korobacteraceae bacterium]
MKMKRAFWFCAICLLVCVMYSVAQDKNQSAALKAQVGLALNAQQLVPPTSATVFVMYASGLVNGSFTHGADGETTAGRQYDIEREKLFGSNKELKALSRKKPPFTEQEHEQLSTLSLAIVDESLQAASDWVSKKPDREWQIAKTTADAQGFWTLDGMKPGSYEIVVRGRIQGHEADWEAAVDIHPGQTLTLPLTKPRYVRSGTN